MPFRIISSFLFFLLLGPNLFSQNQNNQWRFGNFGGIDFNSNPPTFLSNAAISTGEGGASVADRNTGNLLFYTDGVTVWNSLDQPMPNGTGLTGGSAALLSSTTAAVIIPKPGTTSFYYIVTIDEQFNGNGLRYSLVDMTLNGGLGDIVSGQKNIPLLSTDSEKLEVVPNSTCQGYWIITHDNPGDTFYAIELLSSGFQTNPVVSVVGGTHGNGAGHLKINRQFNKLACGNFFDRTIELYDFDNATGIVSNPTIWNTPDPNLVYGVEFSPNGNLLYISNLSEVYQYDLTQSTASAIQSSAFRVLASSFSQPASLQLAPDGKIYLNAGTIDAINFPDNPGAACGYQQRAFTNQFAGGGYGLPKWVFEVSSGNQSIQLVGDSCLGTQVQFSLGSPANVTSVNWDFGDPGSGTNNSSTLINPTHLFSGTGNFIVTAVIQIPCGTDTLRANFSVVDCNLPCIANVNPPADSCLQSAFFFTVSSGSFIFSLEWNFGDPNSGIDNNSTQVNPTHTFSGPGTYTVTTIVQLSCGADTVQTNIRVVDCEPPCLANLSPPTDSCLQSALQFGISSDSSISSVFWNFGDPSSGIDNNSTIANPAHLFSGPGTYTITAIVELSCGTDTLETVVSVVECDLPCFADLSPPTDSCLQSVLQFGVSSDSSISSVEWNFGDPVSGTNNNSALANPTHIFSSPGTYTVTAVVELSCGTDTLQTTVTVLDCSEPCEGVIVNQAEGCLLPTSPFVILSDAGVSNVLWDFGDTNSGTANQSNSLAPFHEFSSPGLYYITAFVSFSCGNDTLQATYRAIDCDTLQPTCALFIPTAFSPNADGLNDDFSPITSCSFQTYRLEIFNRWGQLLFETDSSTDTWNGTFRGKDCPSGVYVYKLTYQVGQEPLDVIAKSVTLLR
jgi:gliding motility-associated-like protein